MILFSVCVFMLACNTTKSVVKEEPEEIIEERVLEPIVVSEPAVEKEEEKVYELERYNPAFKRTVDLIHTKLDLKFDWENQHVLGLAELKLKPMFYDLESVTLDAKGIEF